MPPLNLCLSVEIKEGRKMLLCDKVILGREKSQNKEAATGGVP